MHPHHRETYLKRLRERTSAFPFQRCEGSGTWSSVPSDARDDGERSLIPGSLPTHPRQTTRRTHLAWGDSAREFKKSSRENKTGEIRKTLSFALFRFDRLRLRLGSSSSLRRAVVARRCLVSCLSYPILFLLARSVSIGRPNRRGPARQLNARGIAKPPRSWSFAHHHDHHYHRHYHILLEILCLTSTLSHTHAYAPAGAATLCIIYRSTPSHVR